MATFMLIINIVIILVAIVLIISVLMQQGNRAGLGTIGGGAETFFGKSKAKSYEGKLELITKISAAVFTLLVIVLAATYNRYGTTTSVPQAPIPVATVAPAGEATVAPATESTVAPVVSAAAELTATIAPNATAMPTVAAEAAATAAPLATEAPAATPAA
jgi:preprotein translocase subunit SecG